MDKDSTQVGNTEPSEVSEEGLPLDSRDDALEKAGESIADAVSSSSDQLGTAIHRLESTVATLQPTPDTITPTEVAFAVFVAIIGAFSAYLFNYFHWKTVTRHEKQARVGVALRKLVGELEGQAVGYWLTDYLARNQVADKATEIGLISKTSLVSKYVNIYLGCQKGATDSDIAKLNRFGGEIYDLVTGGDFQSRARKSSVSKAQEISKKCSNVAAVLSALDSQV